MAGQLVGQRLDVIDAPRSQYHACALREKKPGVASPSPLLAPVMTTTFLSTLSLTILLLHAMAAAQRPVICSRCSGYRAPCTVTCERARSMSRRSSGGQFDASRSDGKKGYLVCKV
jgi:hypothetical protein